jgi:hypothetical protein
MPTSPKQIGMAQLTDSTAPVLGNLLPLTRQDRQRLLKVFWSMAAGLFMYEFFWADTPSILSNYAALLITAAALLPTYLWCAGKAQGLPIFPLFALTFVWTYALPLVTHHPRVLTYSPTSHLSASIIVAGCLCLGTWVWFQFVRSRPPLPKTYRALDSQISDAFFLSVLAIGILFTWYFVGGWFALSGGVFAVIRGTVLGLMAIAVFVLAYRFGTQELSKRKAGLFLGLLMLYIVANASALLLVGAASTCLTAIIAFIVGRKKVPILPIVLLLCCLCLLHIGKAGMRQQYWGRNFHLQPWDYPAWYAQWISQSFDYLNQQQNEPSLDRRQSFLERSSVIHLFLMVQDKSPDPVPYLSGKTYAIIPQLLIPRLFNPAKIRSHEGTYLLNIHYGLQTREQAFKTTIGWGLLAEVYANFGQWGCFGLAAMLGAFYGQVTRWCLNTPLPSARSLFAVLLMTYAFQTEWTAGVYVAALFQSSAALGGIVIVFMKPYRVMVLPTSSPPALYPRS